MIETIFFTHDQPLHTHRYPLRINGGPGLRERKRVQIVHTSWETAAGEIIRRAESHNNKRMRNIWTHGEEKGVMELTQGEGANRGDGVLPRQAVPGSNE